MKELSTRSRRIVLFTIICILLIISGGFFDFEDKIMGATFFSVASLLFIFAPFLTEDINKYK